MTMLRCAGMPNLTDRGHRPDLLPDYSWAKQDRETRLTSSLLSFRGGSEATEPGIQYHGREYGFRACAKEAHPGMTTDDVADE